MDTTVVLTTTGGPWLGAQLAALAGQTRPPAQLVLVNNGPAGAVDGLVRHWRDRLPGLELVEDDGAAVCGYARNAGAARARHPGLLFVDDDDVVAPGYVAAMSAALDGADLVGARIDVAGLNPPALTAHWGDMQAEGLMGHHGFLPWVIGGALGVRRSVFRAIGGFDTSLLVAEDTDLSWRAQLDAGATVAFVPGALMSYRLRDRVGPAFRQARVWARWDAVLHERYRDRGLPPASRSERSPRRWARPVLVAATARRRADLVVAARLLGACLGRTERPPVTGGRPAPRPPAPAACCV